MDHNYDILAYASNEVKNQSVIATIIKVDGSSYRKEGTMMLLKSNGENVGILSVGCLEEELSIQAKRILETEEIESTIIEYDLSSENDLGWGRGAGCNGKITVLIEKLNGELQGHLRKIKQLLNNGLKVVAIKKLTHIPDKIETKYIIENGNSFGNELGFQKGNYKDKKTTFSYHLLKDFFYVHHFHPRSRLFIFGAGVDARPVATMATKLNFNVFVWDWRSENLINSHFPSVTILPPSFDWKNIEITKSDLVMMMTHDFQKDKQLLHHFLSFNLKYIGILGPRKRTKRLLNGKEIPPHLHSPIGLKIGADGPWEIAISILAEIIENNRKEASNENEFLGGLFRENDDELVRKAISNDK